MTCAARRRIAVIGSGIAGLAVAWRLSGRAAVTVYERRSVLGLGAQGHVLDTPDGPRRVDVPPRVFNNDHYGAFAALLREVGMPTYDIVQRPEFCDVRGRSYLRLATVTTPGGLRHRVRGQIAGWPWLARHGYELLRWHRFVQRFEPWQVGHDETARAALARLGFSDAFRDSFLYPMWALMCTCRYQHLDAFPAAAVFALARHFAGAAVTRRLDGGTRALERRLIAKVNGVELGTTVLGLSPRADGVMLECDADPQPRLYDHVILATEPAASATLLGSAGCAVDRELVEQVPTHATRMVLHRAQGEPPGERAAAVTMHCDAKSRRSWATIRVNAIERAPLGVSLVQSWEPVVEPASQTVLADRHFQRALLTPASQRAMRRLRERMASDSTPDCARRIWVVGSYVGDGVPLLETGVQSANDVALLVQRCLARTSPEVAQRAAG